VVVADLPPFTAATARFLLAAAVLWLFWLLWPNQRQQVARGDWKWLALAGFFQTSLYFALQYAGVASTSASNATVIVNTRPIFAVLLAALFLRERLTWQKVLAIILGFLGVLVITSQGSLNNLRWSTAHTFGDLLILLNALSGAIGLVLTKRVLRKYRPFPALVYTISFGALGLLPFAGLEIYRQGGIPMAGWLPWTLLLYQALFCSLVAHILWNNVLARLEASQTAVFIYLSPVIGVLLSWLLLDEKISMTLVLGGAFVIAAAYLSTRVSAQTGRTH